MERLNKPIIMTAQMGKADFAWADSLRRRYFPPERNQISAHITLFHHLPPQALDEIKAAVSALAADLPKLLALRMELAERFAGLLTAQDQQTPRLHVTIQNKVVPKEAKRLFDELSAEFEPRPFVIHGIALHYYLDGPWQDIGSWPFRGR